MAFLYPETARGRGKSSVRADIFAGRFVVLIPDEKIVEAVAFETDDPAFTGTMTVTTTLTPVSSGTKVTFLAENVPPGITASDHRAAMESPLKKLALFIE